MLGQVWRALIMKARNPNFCCRHLPLIFLFFSLRTLAFAQWAPLNPVVSFQKQDEGLLLAMTAGTLEVEVCSPTIIHVRYAASSSIPNQPEYVVIKNAWPATQWSSDSNDESITVNTSRLKVVIARKEGGITYFDRSGKQLLNEASRKLTPGKVNGEDTYRAESMINIYGSPEALYGLGQHQAGVWNYR